MNYHQYKEACKNKTKGIHYWANKCRKIQKTLEYNPDPKATVRHHLRDTEEQRKYNDEHYEYFGFNQDGTFEYGKHVIFITKEEHDIIHKDSDETKYKKSVAGKLRWQDASYRDHMTKAICEVWADEHRRHQRSKAYSGNGNPFYGKHHSQETKEKYFIGESNPMYGVIPSEETRHKISEANKGKIVSDDTRNKLSVALYGERNGMYGKRPPEGCWNKAKYLQEQASIAYRNHKNNGGTTPWIEFRREYMRAHKNDRVE